VDHLQSIRAFISVAELGSYMRAADSMLLSRANISRLVTDLEARLHTRLLNRTTRSVSLTEAGKIYLQRARQIVDDIQHLDQAITTRNSEPSGILRIAASLSLEAQVLVNAVRTYLARYPKVRPHLSLVDDSIDSSEEGFDIGVALGVTNARAVTQQVGSCRRVACATPAYLKTYGTPIHPSQLPEHSCLSISGSSESAHDSVEFMGSVGKVQVRLANVLMTNNPPMLRQFALRGMGIAILPGYLVESDIMQGHLVRVLASYRLPRFELKVSYLRLRSANGKIRSFVDHLMGHFDREWKEMASEEQSGRIGPSATQPTLLENEPEALCSLC
jgi:DNA-binding transcriptional LysR family regulator